MKKAILILLTIIITVAVTLFFTYAPSYVDRENNRYPSSVEYRYPDFHNELFIGDLHNDFFLWDRNFLEENTQGHSDLPRLNQGNVALQVFSAVTKVPFGQNFHSNDDHSDMIQPLVIAQRWPMATWDSPHERALYQAKRLEDAAANSRGKLRLIRSRADLIALHLDRAYEPDLMGTILAIEGAQALDGKINSLDTLYDAGYRMIGLSHFFDTPFGGSAHGEEKHGLTNDGRKLLNKMIQKNMLIDLAHASASLFEDVVNYTNVPLFVSHTGVKGTCDSPRNLSDQQLQQVAASDGLVGIAFFPGAICGTDIQDIVSAIQHAVDVMGVEHVALGSDFDGAVFTPFSSKDMAALTDALIAARFSMSDIKAIMGGNMLRVFTRTLPSQEIVLDETMEYVF